MSRFCADLNWFVKDGFNPLPSEMVAVNDSFGESSTPTQLLKKYGLGPENVVAAAEKVLKGKK